MESLTHSVTVQMNQIFELLYHYLRTTTNSSKSNLDIRKQKRFVDEKPILRQMNQLKSNLQKIIQTCQSLQNQNKVLKRMIIRSNSASSIYSIQNHNHSFHIQNSLLNKYLSKVTSSHYSKDLSNSSFQQNQSQLSCFNSSAQFERIKQEVNGLAENLKTFQKAYDKYELDSTNDRENKDMFLDQPSLARFGSNFSSDHDPSISKEDINLENLLCEEELSFDNMSLQDKEHQKVNNEQNMVGSLIAKGIQFRESRTMRSKEYQTLSDLIKQYRENIKCKENIDLSKVKSERVKAGERRRIDKYFKSEMKEFLTI